MPKLFVATALALAADFAAAHAGHGFASPHWHASDLFLPALMLGCAGAALWLGRDKQ